MDSNELLEKYSPLLRRYWLPLGLCVLGLIFLGYGVIGYLGGKKEQEDIFFDGAFTSASVSTNLDKQNSRQATIAVDIEGAVQKPGVYKLPLDSRVQDMLIAAGGLAKDADREKVAKSLNLAAKLTDGAKLYIPFIGEVAVVEGTNGGGSVMGDATNGVININSAPESELDSLPGIGRVTANKIISNRPYGSIDELAQKKIVGQKVFEEIKEKISVY